MSSIKEIKKRIRNEVWRLMEEKGVAVFPRPVYGRIPNFIGSEIAAKNILKLDFIRNARIVKVNPDSPQRPVRELLLKLGKKIIMPTPRLKKGFLLLDPSKIPGSEIRFASTIRGAFIWGRSLSLKKIPNVDVIIVGSVAVSHEGYRIGKGGGYSELEYAILREVGAIDDNNPVVTTIHEIQLRNNVPHEDHDVPVDFIVTPKRIIEIVPRKSKPNGIIWSKITSEMLMKMPILIELKNYVKKAK